MVNNGGDSPTIVGQIIYIYYTVGNCYITTIMGLYIYTIFIYNHRITYVYAYYNRLIYGSWESSWII